jgi:hypothetical protein
MNAGMAGLKLEPTVSERMTRVGADDNWTTGARPPRCVRLRLLAKAAPALAGPVAARAVSGLPASGVVALSVPANAPAAAPAWLDAAHPLPALCCRPRIASRSSVRSRRALTRRIRAVATALRAAPCRPARSDNNRRAPGFSVPRHPLRRLTSDRSRRLSVAARR